LVEQQLLHVLQHHRVFQEELLGVENPGVLGTHRLRDMSLDIVQFLARLGESLLDALEFVRRLPVRQLIARDVNVVRFADHYDPAVTNPVRNRDASEVSFGR
jgi:hypothetical protein